MKEVSLNAIRKEEAAYHQQLYSGESPAEVWLDHPVRDLIDLGIELTAKKNCRFLDLGCGLGRNSFPFLTRGTGHLQTIDMVDILPIAIEKVTEKAERLGVSSKINGYVADICEFDLKPKYYDYIYGVSTLEHAANIAAMTALLQRIKDSLVEEGVVYLVVNSEVTERDSRSGELMPVYFEVNLPTDEMIGLLRGTFHDFKEHQLAVKELAFPINRSSGETLITTNAITFIAQK